MYKGNLQVATSKFGSYKKIGEDTFPFCEVPKWSEYQWVQDPHNRNMLVSLYSLFVYFLSCASTPICLLHKLLEDEKKKKGKRAIPWDGNEY